ncbi:hypothetical protein ABPG72_004040 [Tetrahymena utriculariae]
MSQEKLREVEINTLQNSVSNMKNEKQNQHAIVELPPIKLQQQQQQQQQSDEQAEDEKNRLLKQDSDKKNQNRTSIDTNSKNEATEALTELTKKVNPRISQIGIEAQKESNRSDSNSNQGDSKNLSIFKDEEEEKSKQKKYKVKLFKIILDSSAFQIIVNLFTIYSLFADDIKVMTTRKDADLGFDVCTIIAIFTFVAEIIMSMVEREGYTFSFFFWLDILSTVSMILDINMLTNLIFNSGSGQIGGVQKAGQASRVGSKAGRVVRLVRLIRIVKLYKAAQQQHENRLAEKNNQSQNNFKLMEKIRKRKMKKKVHPGPIDSKGPVDSKGQFDSKVQSDSKGPNESSGQFNDGQDQASKSQVQTSSTKDSQIQQKGFNPPKESKVSRILTDITTKRVIILVLVLVFIMPLFSVDYYFDPPSPIDISVKQMKMVCETQSTIGDIQNQMQYIVNMFNVVPAVLSYFQSPFPDSYGIHFQDSDYDNLRYDEKLGAIYTFDYNIFMQYHSSAPDDIKTQLQQKLQSDGALNLVGVMSLRQTQIISSALSFCNTIFVCIVLTAGAILFSKDASDLALDPIERMRDKVIAIANDPLSSKDQKLISDEDNKEQYETIIIENAIVKIGTLLALGFGEAGSEIIAINMGRQGDVDPMIPGKKKCAIYGFCDIRNFTDATEVLQEDVMLFVNNIGDIVHTITDRFLGAANKNIGDAFLLVWRINEQKYSINDETNEITFSDEQYISILSDYACLAFLRIQSQINRVPKILAYREDKRLQDRIENYKVKMGFGLHIGWGIEGAIGSEFKIDASYLSPNVNMAARLEAATKQYGVPLLISSDLQSYFTPEMKSYTRYIDRVTVKGSIRPIGLYTVDMDVENMPPKKEADPNLTKHDIHSMNQIKKEEMKDIMEQSITGQEPWNADQFIQETKDLYLLFDSRNQQFQDNFAQGFQKYLDGDWDQSKNILNAGLKMCPDDGPTRTILEVMGGFGFQAPQDWKGFRELTEK